MAMREDRFGDALAIALSEARRFIKAAEAARKRVGEFGVEIGTPESAASKRASMDLTRALARVRRGGR